MPRPTAERRHALRLPVSLEVVLFPCLTQGDYQPSRIRDLSLEGMAIDRPVGKLEKGQMVGICLDPNPGESTLERTIRARVVYIGEQIVGLHFQMMGIEAITTLRALINQGPERRRAALG